MSELRDKILHRRSPVLSKRPLITDIDDGELAINYNSLEPGLYFKDFADDGTRKIRKIGPIHFGDTPPNSFAEIAGYPLELSNGECWIDTSEGEDSYILKVWNSENNQWIKVSAIYARKDDNLDQFLNAEDGDDFIHTEGIRLKINNKTALTGLSSSSGNKLLINEYNDYLNGVKLNASLFEISSEEIEQIANNVVFKPHQGYTFTTDTANGVTQTIFGYVSHGLFDGEKIYVFGTLIDGQTPSPVPEGEYFVSDATNDTFKLKTAGGSYVNSAGNIYVSYSPELVFDRDRNIFYSGNLGLKSIDDIISADSNNLVENNWDVFYNPTNKNVRVFARVGNNVEQIQTSVVSIDVKNGEFSENITIGDPVFYSGLDLGSGLGKVQKAKASDPTKMRAIGIAATNMIPGQRGSIVLLGEVSGINSQLISGRLPNNASNVGRAVFVGENGGLTFSQPDTPQNISQSMGILTVDSSTDGTVIVNHPSGFVGLPNLPEDYIWVGGVNDEAVAHYLLPTSFKRTYDPSTQTWTISLADNLEFGSYTFASDGNLSSKVETYVDSTEILQNEFLPTVVESFSTQYRSAKYIVQISGLSAETSGQPVYQICELLVIHNGSQAFVVEYGTVSTYNDERLGQFDANVEGSEVVLRFQKFPLVSSSVQVKAVRTSILV